MRDLFQKHVSASPYCIIDAERKTVPVFKKATNMYGEMAAFLTSESELRHGQLHASATVTAGNSARCLTNWKLYGPYIRTRSGSGEKDSCPSQTRTLVVLPAVIHYTGWHTTAQSVHKYLSHVNQYVGQSLPLDEYSLVSQAYYM